MYFYTAGAPPIETDLPTLLKAYFYVGAPGKPSSMSGTALLRPRWKNFDGQYEYITRHMTLITRHSTKIDRNM